MAATRRACRERSHRMQKEVPSALARGRLCGINAALARAREFFARPDGTPLVYHSVMILIYATIELKEGVRDEAVPACIDHASAGLSEPGCHQYLFTGDLLNPARLHVLERWESLDLMQKHMDNERSMQFAKLMNSWAQKVSVNRFNVLDEDSDEFRRQSAELMGDSVER